MATACDLATVAESYGGSDRPWLSGLFEDGQNSKRAAIAQRRAPREHVRRAREHHARNATALFGRRDHGGAVAGDGAHRQTVSGNHARSGARTSGHEAQHLRTALAETLAQVRGHGASAALSRHRRRLARISRNGRRRIMDDALRPGSRRHRRPTRAQGRSKSLAHTKTSGADVDARHQ